MLQNCFSKSEKELKAESGMSEKSLRKCVCFPCEFQKPVQKKHIRAESHIRGYPCVSPRWHTLLISVIKTTKPACLPSLWLYIEMHTHTHSLSLSLSPEDSFAVIHMGHIVTAYIDAHTCPKHSFEAARGMSGASFVSFCTCIQIMQKHIEEKTHPRLLSRRILLHLVGLQPFSHACEREDTRSRLCEVFCALEIRAFQTKRTRCYVYIRTCIHTYLHSVRGS